MVCTYLLLLNFYNCLLITRLKKMLLVYSKQQQKKGKNKKAADKTASEVPFKQMQIFDEAVQMFEDKCQSLSHFCFQRCKMTGISIKKSSRNHLLCPSCQASQVTSENIIKDL